MRIEPSLIDLQKRMPVLEFHYRVRGSGGFHEFGRRLDRQFQLLERPIQCFDSMRFRRGGFLGLRSTVLRSRLWVSKILRNARSTVVVRVVCESPDFLKKCPKFVYKHCCFVTTFEFVEQVREVRDELTSVAKIVVPTEWHRECLESEGFAPEGIAVVPLPSRFESQVHDVSSPGSSKTVDSRIRILSVMSSLDRRDISALIRGFTLFLIETNDSVDLTLKVAAEEVGEVIDLQINEISRSLGLSDDEIHRLRQHIQVVSGWATDEEITALLNQSDAYVSSERLSGWDIPFHDAVELGLPSNSLRLLSTQDEVVSPTCCLGEREEVVDSDVVLDRVAQVSGDARLLHLKWTRLSDALVRDSIRELVMVARDSSERPLRLAEEPCRDEEAHVWSAILQELGAKENSGFIHFHGTNRDATEIISPSFTRGELPDRRNSLILLHALGDALWCRIRLIETTFGLRSSTKQRLRRNVALESAVTRKALGEGRFSYLWFILRSARMIRHSIRVLRLSGCLKEMRHGHGLRGVNSRSTEMGFAKRTSRTAVTSRGQELSTFVQRVETSPVSKTLGGRRLLESAFSGVPLAQHDVSRLYGVHHARGRRAEELLVIGNAPSLLKANLDFIAEFDTFAVNRIDLLFEASNWRPTYYTSLDWEVGPRCFAEFRSPKTVKFCPLRFRGLAGTQDSLFYGVREIDPAYDFDPYLYPILGMPSGATVVTTAISIGAFLGYKTIVLIGVDCDYKVPEKVKRHVSSKGQVDVIESLYDDDPNHFSKNYFGEGWRWHDPKPDQMIRTIGKQAELLAKCGVDIFNGSPYGRLDSVRREVRSEFWTSG